MLQYSKMVKSRKEWKDKATIRGDENRQHRKAKKLHLEKIAKLKTKIRQLEQAVEVKKNH
jgi:hypothetical protein